MLIMHPLLTAAVFLAKVHFCLQTVLRHMHHQKFVDFRFSINLIFHAPVYAFLCTLAQTLERLRTEIFKELLHGHIALQDVGEELLCVGPSLSARSGRNMLLYFLPIFAEIFQSLEKPYMLHHGPTAILLLALSS